MHIAKIPYYIKKIAELGPSRSYQIAEQRLRDVCAEKVWRYLARHGKAAHTVFLVTKKYRMHSWQIVECLKVRSLPSQIEQSISLSVELANHSVEKKFNLLGSGQQQFVQIPWHTDFRLQARQGRDVHFDATSFFKDISIEIGPDWQEKKDIKIPWELSRLQYVPVVGRAYKHTGDEKYVLTFVEHVTDWQEKNPFLHGINWLCPMEVGIRAANLVIAWTFFAQSSLISEKFWQLLFCLLNDHLVYLENTWEIYDSRTSNHYLGDLIGYYYLCWLFKDLPGFSKKLVWCRAQLLSELGKQVFPDGTDYEGSTTYHRLVTQMFYHSALLSKDVGLPFDAQAQKKIDAMHEFIAWCTPIGGQLITIGDDDSGSLVHQTQSLNILDTIGGKKQFLHFGLSVYKTQKLHLTLRHHRYNTLQPSGHFHNDVGSLTLAVQGKPFFVDPGSYVYTPSRQWREYFRSVKQHSTFYIQDHEPIPFDDRLFAMEIPECNAPSHIFSLKHDLYKRCGLQAQRMVEVNEQENHITITDSWHSLGKVQKSLVSAWNFTLAPQVCVKNILKNELLLIHEGVLLRLWSEQLEFKIEEGWIARGYGEKMSALMVRAQRPIRVDEKIVMYIGIE